MNIIVSGSLAYDRIMDFPGHFSDHILPDKIHVLNVSFTVNGMKEKFGGTAGNIAYGLRLLGEDPVVVATIGHDHQRYFEWLAKNHIATDTIKVVDFEFTASAYITTDQADNQITGFNPGAMRHPSYFSFEMVDPAASILIIAPGNLEDMKTYSTACRKKGIPYIFDPGQSLPMWNGSELLEAITGSKVLISNDYELDLVMKMTGLEKSALLGRTGAIVTTLGEVGSRVTLPDRELAVPAVKPDQVLDPTGAGDAYRAGLLRGLALGKDLHQSAIMGAVCASFAVECYGTQDYYFDDAFFQERLAQHEVRA